MQTKFIGAALGLALLGVTTVPVGYATASGISSRAVYSENPDPTWAASHPVHLPPASQWGRVDGRVISSNPTFSSSVSRYLDMTVNGLLQWMPIQVTAGPYSHPHQAWTWGWGSTWSTNQLNFSSDGSFSFTAPPGRYSISISSFNAFAPNSYNGQPNGGGSELGLLTSSPNGFHVPPKPFVFTVRAGETTHLVTTRLFPTQVYSYHGLVSGPRSELDLFGLFEPGTKIASNAPGVSFTAPTFVDRTVPLFNDMRLHTTVIVGPGARAGTYLLSVKSPYDATSTTMTLYKAPGSKDFFARFGVPYNFAQA